MKVRLRNLVGVFLLLAALGTMAAVPDTRNYRAHLTGASEAVETLATGQAIFQFSRDGTMLSYKLIVANLENVTQAHIHIAPPGEVNGPVRLWLYPAVPPATLIPGTFSGVLGEGVAQDGDAGLVEVTLSELKAAIDEGRAYVNVHTTANPGGEIRGQLH